MTTTAADPPASGSKLKLPTAVVYLLALRDNSQLVSARSGDLAEIRTIKQGPQGP